MIVWPFVQLWCLIIYKVPINYPRLLKLLETKPFGTVFGNLRSLQVLGLHVLIEEGSRDRLAGYIATGLPCIAAIKTGPTSLWHHVCHHNHSGRN